MSEVEVPAEGVALAYDLQPGTVADGHVLYRESAGNSSSSQVAEFDVAMLVKKRDDSGRAIVKARIKNLRLVWSMGGMASDVVDESEVVQSCQQLLEGSDVQFSIAPDGKISDFPDASEAQGIPDITRLCVETLLEALESSLVELLDEPMTTGKSWTNEDTKGRKGRLGRYVERTTRSTFEGLFTRTDGPEDRLAIINSDTRELTTVTTNAITITTITNNNTATIIITTITTTTAITASPFYYHRQDHHHRHHHHHHHDYHRHHHHHHTHMLSALAWILLYEHMTDPTPASIAPAKGG